MPCGVCYPYVGLMPLNSIGAPGERLSIENPSKVFDQTNVSAFSNIVEIIKTELQRLSDEKLHIVGI